MEVPIFCSYDELLAILASVELSSNPFMGDSDEVSLQFLRMLSSGFSFHFDDMDRFDQDVKQGELYAKYLVKRHFEGRCFISADSWDGSLESVRRIATADALLFYYCLFISSSPAHSKLARTLGCVLIGRSNWRVVVQKLHVSRLLTATSHGQYNNLLDWEIFSRFVVPSRVLFLADRYLLADTNSFHINLFLFIRVLTWQDDDSKVTLRLVYAHNENNIDVGQFIQLFRDYFDGCNISLELYRVPRNKFHGRELLGNYFYINVDHSVDLFETPDRIRRGRRAIFNILGLGTLLANSPSQYEEILVHFHGLTHPRYRTYPV